MVSFKKFLITKTMDDVTFYDIQIIVMIKKQNSSYVSRVLQALQDPAALLDPMELT